jgi:glycosyltransferase involved in cell wall biosynthesis
MNMDMYDMDVIVTGTSAISMSSTTVSIITVSQYSRMECLRNLSDLIKLQLYENILEWVIVEGSPTKIDAFVSAQNVEAIRLSAKFKFPIVYIPYADDENVKLSDLRNTGNATCKGDIIVCMDDDDYYPPTRISHAVYKLNKSSALIAGCSKAHIYFFLTNHFFQFASLGQGHSTNNCMAYKRAYLKNHAHTPHLSRAEESSFTNDFSEPMVQLDPMKTIVISGHSTNTVDKTFICQNLAIHKMVTQLDAAKEILDYIPLPILLRMEKIFETYVNKK